MAEQKKIEKIEEAVDHIREHINTRYELVVLRASEKISNVAAEIIAGFLIVFISVLTILMLSFGAAYYFSLSRNDSYSGFLIVGGIYLAGSFILIVFRKKLLSFPIRNKIIKQFFKED